MSDARKTTDSEQADRTGMGEGRYANYAEIGHNAHEFIFDFGQVWLEGEPARVYMRVVTNSQTAENLHEALDAALSMYRDSFGDVRHDRQPENGKTA